MALKFTRAESKSIAEAKDLATDAVGDVIALGNVLRETLDRLREEFDSRSERWQETERGQAASEWLDGVEEVVDDVERLAGELADAVDNVVGLEEAPSEF